MRPHALTRLSLATLLMISLAACGVGKRQSPVATDDEAGQTKPVSIEEDKPSTYVTKSGDTLRGIAGRDEIYGEPDLWPALLDANLGTLGSQTDRSKLATGITLAIPRNLDEAALADAREKARQAAASTKAAHKPKSMEAPEVKHAVEKPVQVAKAAPVAAAKPVKPVASAPAKPAAKAAKASAKVETADSAKPVPKVKKSGGLLPVLFFLLLLLAVLAAVLFYFTRRDQKDAEG